ncbi:MAG: hypothetical protein AAGJ97_03130 [Planctomycetota bacterium]
MSRAPGYKSGRTVTPVEIFYNFRPTSQTYKPGGVTIAKEAVDGGNGDYTYEIRPGWPLGRLTATNKCVPLKRTRIDGAASGATNVTVDVADAFAVGDTVTVGATAGQTISAIDYATGVITLAAAVTAADDAVFHAEDGSENCIGFCDELIVIEDEDRVAHDFIGASLVVEGSLDHGRLQGDVDALISHAAANYGAHGLKAISIWKDGIQVF